MNLFRMTKDGSLDRQYLRVAAVYRCVDRLGMSRSDAVTSLSERMSEREARALVSIWGQVRSLRYSPTFNAA